MKSKSIALISILLLISVILISGCVDQPIGGETDEHGCMLMAGYTWCELKQQCLREWEEPCEGEPAPVPSIVPEPLSCAEDGEQFSAVYDEYPEHCCEGLKEWLAGMDKRFSIADECYETGIPSGLPVGICITCGDGICENHPNYNENPCNCPEDCAGKGKSMFSSVEEFCNSNDWNISLSVACEETIGDFPICELC